MPYRATRFHRLRNNHRDNAGVRSIFPSFFFYAFEPSIEPSDKIKQFRDIDRVSMKRDIGRETSS